MQDIQNEIATFFSKWSAYIIGTLIGVVGKISYEIGMKRKLSLVQWCAVAGVSIFMGYLVSVLCATQGWENQAGWIVPAGTLLGEKILLYVSNNYQDVFSKLIGIFVKQKDNANNKP